MDTEKYSSPLDLKAVRLTDGFWSREQKLVREEVLPYQWEALNDRVPGAAPSYCMHNFKAAGRLLREKLEKGKDYVEPAYTFRGFEALPEDPAHPDPLSFYGFVFQDSDFSKWIEAVAYALAAQPDPELERTADEAIELVCAAQLENGYLDTYYILNGMDRAFTNLRDHHELYCFGHLAEGAVAYRQATGKDRLLRAAMRFADYIDSRFGPEEGKIKGYPGHEIAEMALARLYEATGEKRYLDLSKFFLDMRGTRPYYFDLEEQERARREGRVWRPGPEGQRYSYHQAHMPVREQKEAVGHAVRAVYLYSGMADVARLTGDEELYRACVSLWDSVERQKLYLTGGIGATHLGEAFSFPFDLPNDTAYAETCASIGLVFWAQRMLRIRAEGRYGDVMERALYNGVLSGMALDGRSFFYVNPLEAEPEACRQDARKAHVKPVRQKWFGCACCPPNLARLIGSLAQYAYTEREAALWFHLYVGGTVSKRVGDRELRVRTESDFPWDGNVRVRLHEEKDGKAGGRSGIRCTLAFRVPGWCRRGDVQVLHGGQLTVIVCENGGASVTSQEPGLSGVRVEAEHGYLYLTADWKEGDSIELKFPMEVRMVTANPKVRENIGKVAFTRGPVVFCMEEADNGKNLHLCRVDIPRIGGRLEGITVEESRELGHEMRVLQAPGRRLADERDTASAGEAVEAVRDMASEGSGMAETEGDTASVERCTTNADSLYRDYQPPREQEITLRLIPYYAWNNRGEGEMTVWIRA